MLPGRPLVLLSWCGCSLECMSGRGQRADVGKSSSEAKRGSLTKIWRPKWDAHDAVTQLLAYVWRDARKHGKLGQFSTGSPWYERLSARHHAPGSHARAKDDKKEGGEGEGGRASWPRGLVSLANVSEL